MADYRMDCCGGFTGDKSDCGMPAKIKATAAAKEAVKANLDALYQRYGELVAESVRQQSDVARGKAEGVLIAIRLIEGK